MDLARGQLVLRHNLEEHVRLRDHLNLFCAPGMQHVSTVLVSDYTLQLVVEIKGVSIELFEQSRTVNFFGLCQLELLLIDIFVDLFLQLHLALKLLVSLVCGQTDARFEFFLVSYDLLCHSIVTLGSG